jgi:hypothetical protein
MNIQKHILPKQHKFKLEEPPKKKGSTTTHLVVTAVGLATILLIAKSLKEKAKPDDSEAKSLYDLFVRGLLLL